MARLALFLLIVWTTPYALCQTNSPPNPLTEGEKRQILNQLYELKSCRAMISSYEKFLAREKEQDERERQNWARAVELEKQATAAAEKERDLEKDKVRYWETAYKTVTKQRGIGCTLAKVFTLGLARCR